MVSTSKCLNNPNLNLNQILNVKTLPLLLIWWLLSQSESDSDSDPNSDSDYHIMNLEMAELGRHILLLMDNAACHMLPQEASEQEDLKV